MRLSRFGEVVSVIEDHQPLIPGSSYSLWVGLDGGQLEIVAQHLMVDGSEPLQRSGYQ
jgi:hypothetical protein